MFVCLCMSIVLAVQGKIGKCGQEGSDCTVVSKNVWGGLQPVKVEYLPRPIELVIIQHSATPACRTDNACGEIVRNIQTNHIDSLGYWDIGPSFLVGGNGKIYEGTGWLHVGAHTLGYNRKSIGISFIGNYDTDQPTPEALSAVKALIACGVKRGHLKPNYKVVAHRQLIATISPGNKLYNEIRKWPEWLQDVGSIKDKK